ncbi:MAG: ATP-dependent helicase HrpB, partial [Acetobacteraceae bacterium]|nr:ATP-dependent helicase HrpB [Acetobacteraceae bacterium]
ASLPALTAALAAGRNAVLVAPPGAGKTTLAPLSLLDAPWRGDGRIVMLEPRRLAARAAARRMAALLGEAPGETVGWRTRLDRAIGPGTVIEVVTEGLLVRRLLADPSLQGTACVILDEVHERALDSDLALALLLEAQAVLRADLRLVAMSATADTARLVPLMNALPVASTGRAHNVEIVWATEDSSDRRDLPMRTGRAIRRLLAAQDGAVLAFLPGMAEILRTRDALEGIEPPIHILHGDIPPAAQDAALSGGRRVVLASAIAETSLTVEGVGAVVDSGYRRAQKFDPGSGLSTLATVRISRAGADQRAGRAGRLGPGLCYRLWTEAAHRALAPFDPPEILSADLAPLVLDCAAWGTRPEALRFADPPPAGALAAARTLLACLGLLDADDRLSDAGRGAARLPAHPRLARMIADAPEPGRALACDIAAVLEEGRGRREGADIRAALDRPSPAARLASRQLRRAAGAPGGTGQAAGGQAGPLLALAFPDRIAARRPTGGFLLASGGGAAVAADDTLAAEAFLAVAALDLSGREARIRLAAPISRDQIEAAFAAVITTRETVALEGDAVVARRRRMLGALVLEETILPRPAPDAAAALLAATAIARGLLAWDAAARNLQARIARMRAIEGEIWPDLGDAALAADPAWLAAALGGATRLADVLKLDLAAALAAQLGGPQRRALDAALPGRVTLPSGRAAPIDYTREVPTLSARAQDFFGLAATPRLAGGRVGLNAELLSPAGRPIAVTADLENFWRRGWAEVRKAMRGRYPKHAWPENPSVRE